MRQTFAERLGVKGGFAVMTKEKKFRLKIAFRFFYAVDESRMPTSHRV